MVLPKTLRVAPGDFEVGLREIQYTTSWNNLLGASIDFWYTKSIRLAEVKHLKLPDGQYKSHKEVIYEIRRCIKSQKTGNARLRHPQPELRDQC